MVTILKVVVSAAVIGLVNVVARRDPTLGGWLAALPLVTLLSLGWLSLDRRPVPEIATFLVGVLMGTVPTIGLLAACVVCLRADLPLAVAIVAGVAVWAGITTAARCLGLMGG